MLIAFELALDNAFGDAPDCAVLLEDGLLKPLIDDGGCGEELDGEDAATEGLGVDGLLNPPIELEGDDGGGVVVDTDGLGVDGLLNPPIDDGEEELGGDAATEGLGVDGLLNPPIEDELEGDGDGLLNPPIDEELPPYDPPPPPE